MIDQEGLGDKVIRLNKQLKGAIKELREIEQILGKVLGYSWYCDNQKNFPGATQADGVCIGDNTAASLAEKAADKIRDLRIMLCG